MSLITGDVQGTMVIPGEKLPLCFGFISCSYLWDTDSLCHLTSYWEPADSGGRGPQGAH